MSLGVKKKLSQQLSFFIGINPTSDYLEEYHPRAFCR
jgi:hypothetical protein